MLFWPESHFSQPWPLVGYCYWIISTAQWLCCTGQNQMHIPWCIISVWVWRGIYPGKKGHFASISPSPSHIHPPFKTMSCTASDIVFNQPLPLWNPFINIANSSAHRTNVQHVLPLLSFESHGKMTSVKYCCSDALADLYRGPTLAFSTCPASISPQKTCPHLLW